MAEAVSHLSMNRASMSHTYVYFITFKKQQVPFKEKLAYDSKKNANHFL